MLVPKLRMDRSVLIDPRDLQQMICQTVEREVRRRREERPPDGQPLLISIRIFRQEHVRIPVAPECGRIDELDRIQSPLPPLLGVQTERASAAEQI